MNGALIYPASRELSLPGNTDFYTAGVGQIDDMRLKTESLAPIGFSAGTGIKMASFRLHDTHIALRQGNKAGITITLIKTLFYTPIAVYAKYLAGICEFYGLADVGIQSNRLICQEKLIVNWIIQSSTHFL